MEDNTSGSIAEITSQLNSENSDRSIELREKYIANLEEISLKLGAMEVATSDNLSKIEDELKSVVASENTDDKQEKLDALADKRKKLEETLSGIEKHLSETTNILERVATNTNNSTNSLEASTDTFTNSLEASSRSLEVSTSGTDTSSTSSTSTNGTDTSSRGLETAEVTPQDVARSEEFLSSISEISTDTNELTLEMLETLGGGLAVEQPADDPSDDKAESNKEKEWGSFREIISKGMEKFSDGLKSLGKKMADNKGSILAGVIGLMAAYNPELVMKGMKYGIDAIFNILEAIDHFMNGDFLKGFGSLFENIELVGAGIAYLAIKMFGFKDSMDFLGDKMKDMGKYLKKMGPKLMTRIMPMLTGIMTSVSAALAPIAASVMAFLAPIGAAIMGFLAPIGAALMSFFAPIAAFITGPVLLIGAAIALTLKSLYDAFKSALNVFNNTGSILSSLIDFSSTFFSTLIGLPLDLLKDSISWLLDAFGATDASKQLDSFSFTDFIKSFIEGFYQKLIVLFNDITEFFAGPIRAISMGISNLFSGLYSIFVQPIVTLFNDIANFFAGPIRTISMGIGNIFNGLYDIFVQPIVSLISDIGSFFAGPITNISSFIIGIMKNLLNIMTTPFELLFNTISDIFDFDFINAIKKSIPGAAAVLDFLGIDSDAPEEKTKKEKSIQRGKEFSEAEDKVIQAEKKLKKVNEEEGSMSFESVDAEEDLIEAQYAMNDLMKKFYTEEIEDRKAGHAEQGVEKSDREIEFEMAKEQGMVSGNYRESRDKKMHSLSQYADYKQDISGGAEETFKDNMVRDVDRFETDKVKQESALRIEKERRTNTTYDNTKEMLNNDSENKAAANTAIVTNISSPSSGGNTSNVSSSNVSIQNNNSPDRTMQDFVNPPNFW